MPCYCIRLRLLSEYEGNPGHNVVFWRWCPTSQPRPSSHDFSQILGKDWAIQIFPDGLHNQCRRLLFLSSLRPPGELVISSSTSCLQAWYIPDNGYLFVSTVPFFPRWFQQSQILTFVVCYTFNAMILMWSFIYRLKAVEK